jgi:AraC-like DNA-binding protein/mannose-6-phosphate isomerase-like protein (cupin superfamily)
MKSKLEQLPHKIDNQSFLCYEVKVPNFEFHWHYHPEYELTYILKGKGKRLVGDNYEPFSEGDLVLLGPNLPHTWVTPRKGKENCQAIVIQFTHAFMTQLFQFPELNALEKLFAKAGSGIKFTISKNKGFVLIMQRMIGSSELIKFTLFLQLLGQLLSEKSIPLASAKYKPMKGNENQQRLNKVFLYVEKEFKDIVSLQRAASIIHLSESAFCKFFKRASGKTFSDYTNEIRIAHACQLLIETDKPVSEIAFESGFNSLTYFNRVFLKKKKIRPGSYRKM